LGGDESFLDVASFFVQHISRISEHGFVELWGGFCFSAFKNLIFLVLEAEDAFSGFLYLTLLTVFGLNVHQR
jgi:hypothetical protein